MDTPQPNTNPNHSPIALRPPAPEDVEILGHLGHALATEIYGTQKPTARPVLLSTEAFGNRLPSDEVVWGDLDSMEGELLQFAETIRDPFTANMADFNPFTVKKGMRVCDDSIHAFRPDSNPRHREAQRMMMGLNSRMGFVHSVINRQITDGTLEPEEAQTRLSNLTDQLYGELPKLRNVVDYFSYHLATQTDQRILPLESKIREETEFLGIDPSKITMDATLLLDIDDTEILGAATREADQLRNYFPLEDFLSPKQQSDLQDKIPKAKMFYNAQMRLRERNPIAVEPNWSQRKYKKLNPILGEPSQPEHFDPSLHSNAEYNQSFPDTADEKREAIALMRAKIARPAADNSLARTYPHSTGTEQSAIQTLDPDYDHESNTDTQGGRVRFGFRAAARALGKRLNSSDRVTRYGYRLAAISGAIGIAIISAGVNVVLSDEKTPEPTEFVGNATSVEIKKGNAQTVTIVRTPPTIDQSRFHDVLPPTNH